MCVCVYEQLLLMHVNGRVNIVMDEDALAVPSESLVYKTTMLLPTSATPALSCMYARDSKQGTRKKKNILLLHQEVMVLMQ